MRNSVKSSDFWCLHHCSYYKRTELMTVVVVTHGYSPDERTRICVAASKKRVSKSAVLRNRAKRRVRALIQKHQELLKQMQIVFLMVVTKKAVCTVPYEELEADYCYAMSRVLVDKEWKLKNGNFRH